MLRDTRTLCHPGKGRLADKGITAPASVVLDTKFLHGRTMKNGKFNDMQMEFPMSHLKRYWMCSSVVAFVGEDRETTEEKAIGIEKMNKRVQA